MFHLVEALEVNDHEVGGDEFGAVFGHVNNKSVQLLEENLDSLAELVFTEVQLHLFDTRQKHEKRIFLHLVQVGNQVSTSLLQNDSH
jgi:hypothetical protein